MLILAFIVLIAYCLIKTHLEQKDHRPADRPQKPANITIPEQLDDLARREQALRDDPETDINLDQIDQDFDAALASLRR